MAECLRQVDLLSSPHTPLKVFLMMEVVRGYYIPKPLKLMSVKLVYSSMILEGSSSPSSHLQSVRTLFKKYTCRLAVRVCFQLLVGGCMGDVQYSATLSFNVDKLKQFLAVNVVLSED